MYHWRLQYHGNVFSRVLYQVSCAAVLFTVVVAVVTASSPTSDKSTAVQSPVPQSASYQGPAAVAYPGPSYQFAAAEYNNPFAKSALAPKAASSSSSSSYGKCTNDIHYYVITCSGDSRRLSGVHVVFSHYTESLFSTETYAEVVPSSIGAFKY